MNEIIDRAAKAMFEASGSKTVCSVEPPWSVYYPLARAAFAAARMPTKAMINAAQESAWNECAESVWQDMIDEILNSERKLPQ